MPGGRAIPSNRKQSARKAAPVKEMVKIGSAADLRDFPIVRHHEMDGGPYIDMTVVCEGPR